MERIREPERVQHELDVYNELLPRPGELSRHPLHRDHRADPGAARARPAGRDRRAREPGSRRAPRRPEDSGALRPRSDGRGPHLRRPVRPLPLRAGPRRAARTCRHLAPGSASTTPATAPRRSSGTPPAASSWPTCVEKAPLSCSRAPVFRREPRVLHETPELRVIRPEPRTSGHLVVELRREGCLLELAPEALAPGLAEVQRRARELSRSHGSCSVSVDAATSPVRWHLRSQP